MYEYKCIKCKKEYEHYLKLVHPCTCGGELKYIYKPITGIEKLEDQKTIEDLEDMEKFYTIEEKINWQKNYEI